MPDETLEQLARNLLSHFIFAETKGDNGEPAMKVGLTFDHRVLISRKVVAGADENGTLEVDAILLNEYLKNPKHEIFKSRMGASEMRKVK